MPQNPREGRRLARLRKLLGKTNSATAIELGVRVKRRDRLTKGTPIIGIQSVLEQEKGSGWGRISMVKDQAEEEDGQNSATSTDDDFETAPPVAFVAETNDQYGDGRSGDQVGDEEDLQHGRRLEGNDHDWEDDQDNGQADVPDVELVSENVVGSR